MAPDNAWFKSSYSGGSGNSCVEVAEVPADSAWFKSSHSGGTGNNCVEVADMTNALGGIGVRDSKDPHGPALLVTPAAWTAFLNLVRTGTVDFDTL